jgi:hypothetical protein
VVIVLVAILFSAGSSDAAEIEPRAYANTPVGVNFLLTGYIHSQGGLSTEASSPIKDAHLTIDTAILAYARSMDVWGMPGKIDVILPYSFLSGDAMVAGDKVERSISGMHDPRVRFSVNFYGAPVLTVEEFAGYQQDLIVGASFQVSPPLGQYDPTRVVNIGNNRWFFKPDIGISKAWGGLTIELSTGVCFFTDNRDYYWGKKQEQNPVSTSQVHVTYNFTRGLWAAVSGTYDYGGRTTVNGKKNDDEQSNGRVGFTLGIPVNRNNSVKLYGSTGVATRTGGDFTLGGIVWQYRWGGGL